MTPALTPWQHLAYRAGGVLNLVFALIFSFLIMQLL